MWPLAAVCGDVRKAEEAVGDQTGVPQLGGQFEALVEARRGIRVVSHKPRDVAEVVKLECDAASITERALCVQALVVERQRLVIASLASQRFDHMVKSGRAPLLITHGSCRCKARTCLLLHHTSVAVEQGNARQPDQSISLQ